MFNMEMSYTSTTKGRGCGGEFYDTRGKFYSPLHPEPFRNSTTCTWRIRGVTGLRTILKFQSKLKIIEVKTSFGAPTIFAI